jgi:hypothetical protein
MPTETDTATEEPQDNLGAEELLMAQIKEQLFDDQPEEVETEEEKPELEELPEDQPEEEDHETVETDDPLSKVPGWQKRIDKLTAQKSDLEERLADSDKLKSDLESQLRSGAENKDQDFAGLVSSVQTIAQLDTLEKETVDTERWAKRLQNRYKRDPESVEEELTKRFGNEIDDPESFLDDFVLNSEDARQFVLPEARKRVQSSEHWRSVAVETYPWLEQQSSQAGSLVRGIIEKHGNKRLNEIPEVQLVLARAVVGYAEEQKRTAKANEPKPEPTRQPGRPSGTSYRKRASSDDADSAAQKVFNGGGREALKDFTLKALMPK